LILASRGIREVNIVSQTTTSYGLDLYGERRLCECIEELVKVKGLRWVRILYTYPAEVGEELLRLISTQEKVCRYLDIPIQHVSDRILKRMRREIGGGTIRERILGIRERYPELFVRSTLIVGFPGETDREFKELFDFVKEVRFERLGVFPFSREEGTPSFRMRGQIPEEIKQERVRAIMELQAGISLEKNREFIGRVVETVLDEEIGGEYLFDGRTEYDAPEIDNGVLIREGSGVVGEFVPVRICDATEYDLIGEIIETEGT
jgi:ribosomal protein S12 methylthiotransferase